MMAIAVAALAPIALVMFLVFSVGGQLNDKNLEIDALETERKTLEREKLVAQWAAARQRVYRAESLPAMALDEAIMEYQLWLTNLARDEIELLNVDVNNRGRSPQVDGREIIFNKLEFKLVAVGSPRQLTELLYRLNHARVLHRILQFNVVPQMTGTASRRTPTGLLELDAVVEVAALTDAVESEDFHPENRDDMLRTLDEYHRIVSRRNLFGPPNTEPKVQRATGSKVGYEPGESIRVNVEIDDPDKDQRYSWELIDPENPDAQLAFDEGSSTATFTAPPLERGSHRFAIRATDDGWPPKSGDLRLTITVEDPPPDDPEPEPPKHARDTYVGGITKLRGEPQVWIQFRREGRSDRLYAGESFELDGMTWTIEKIEDEQVTISVDGEQRVYKQRSSLAEPERSDATTAAVSDR